MPVVTFCMPVLSHQYLSVVLLVAFQTLTSLIQPKLAPELPSRMFVTSDPSSGKSAVGVEVGLPVGLILGDVVGKLVGEYVISSHMVYCSLMPCIHWQAPSTNRSLSVKRSHKPKLFLFGNTPSNSSSSWTPIHCATPFQMASQGVVGIHLPRFVQKSDSGPSGVGYSPMIRPPLREPPAIK